MSSALLVTKLFIPTARPAVVARPQLIERLNEGLLRDLTLISAPAGFGKTTLLAEWVDGMQAPTAWVSLDEGDSELARFLTYLIAALQTISPIIGAEWLEALQSSSPPPTESVLASLVNEISRLPDALVLVLDDYHAIDAPAVDAALTFLLAHLPPQLHLVVSTRQDPGLPVARLRARGQLVELRASDLRFTSSEAAEYLNAVMGLHLAADDIAALERRTEGWVAGLQLAALSMRGNEDVSGFISAFAGDHRYIADYLVGEVLGRQPADVRSFLLQTSIVDRMNGSLCDAVTELDSGSARLESLEQGNFFVVRLDDKRHWYRYHHLFREVLTAYLMEEQPGVVPELHRRASAWYEAAGSDADAIQHSLAGTDFEHAADLVERAWPAMQRVRQEAAFLGFVRALPDRVLDRRPVLTAAYGGALLSTGDLNGVQSRLRDAERLIDAPPTGRVVVDQDAFRCLPGQIAVWRAGMALMQGDGDETVRYAERALELVRADDHLIRGSAAALIGLASWAKGDLDAAYAMYSECITRLHKVGNVSDVLGCSITLADIRITQGRLTEARGVYERGLQLAFNQGGPPLRGAADMHVGLCELLGAQGDLAAARQQLAKSQALGESAGLPQNRYRSCVAMAHICQAEGDLDGAVELLDEAERVYCNDFSPDVRPVAAMRARMLIAQGRLARALDWVNEQGLSAQDELSYLREFEHITLARVLLAKHNSDGADGSSLLDAIGLLERLLQGAEDGRRVGNAIEILVLLALARRAGGDTRAALLALERALTLAEPEGYVRAFVDEGQAMSALLQAVMKQGIARSYVRQLLAASAAPDDATPVAQRLVEPLSERELEVLRLLRTDLDGPDIARQLVVSLNTMRTHTKNIYSKLGVNNRRAAVRRAEELDLFSRTANT